jgi:hypothetical protein
MSKYDDLFDATALDDSVFADKSALDPLAAPDDIVARDDQERRFATILQGVHQGYSRRQCRYTARRGRARRRPPAGSVGSSPPGPTNWPSST